MSNGPAPGRPGRRGVTLRAAAVLASALLGTACARATGTTTATTHGSTGTGGTTVSGQPVPPGTGPLDAVSCGSPEDCWAVGLGVPGVLDQPAGAPTGPATVVVDATDDGGTTWKAERVAVADPTDLAGIACPDRRHCMAVGTTGSGGGTPQGAVLVTADGGRRWHAAGAPAGSVGLSAVECTAAGDCRLLATDGTTYWSASTTDDGKVWQRGGTLPAGFGGPSAMACPGARTCMTAGYVPTTPGHGTGAIAVTTDGGTTWTAATLPPGTGVLHGVACTAPLHCIAVGTTSTTLTDVAQAKGELLASADGGRTWTARTAPAGVDDAFAIACPTTTGCAAVGTVWTSADPPTPVGAVVTTADGGTTWHAPAARDVPVGLAGVDCPAPTSCVAAGNDVLAHLPLPLPERTPHHHRTPQWLPGQI